MASDDIMMPMVSDPREGDCVMTVVIDGGTRSVLYIITISNECRRI